ncbi:MAG: hypothetical protein PVH30_07240 [Desulfobacterales bacterium]
MIVHPVVLAIMVSDGLVLALETGVFLFSFQALLNWNPASSSRGQLRLEARHESADIAAGGAFWLFSLSTLGLVVAVANLFPDLVPGAMCGTGVLQSMGTPGPAALALRLAAFTLLYCRRTAIKINHSDPGSPATLWVARYQLIVFPVVAWAVVASGSALTEMDVDRPVNCCAVVYGAFRSAGAAGAWADVPDRLRLLAFGGTSLLIGSIPLVMARKRTPDVRQAAGLVLLTLFWMAASASALVYVLSAYMYEVLHHHCPWCLFLPIHGSIGFPLFAAWLLAGAESMAACMAAAHHRAFQQLEAVSLRRFRSAARRTAAAAAIFFAMSSAPAVLWRIRFGVWL